MQNQDFQFDRFAFRLAQSIQNLQYDNILQPTFSMVLFFEE